MRNYLVPLAGFLVLLSCGGDNGNDGPYPDPDPIVKEKPVAVDDALTGEEDNTLVISDLLDNDTLVSGSKISSFDATSAQGGTLADNRDGSLTYEPAAAFVGEDTFEYTLCDLDGNCSTATVTLTITDEGSPVAADDTVIAVKNKTSIFSALVDNDTPDDDAKIGSVDASASTGTVVLNENGTVSYTPAADFVGEDTFTYQLCDDDATPSCVTATVTVTVVEPIAFNIPAELQAYYQDLVIIPNDVDADFAALQELTVNKHTTKLSYGERHQYLYHADADLSNPDNVILMYSGESRYWEEYTSPNNPYSPQTFNTEHIYPQSKLGSDEIAKADLHLLRCADANQNQDRSNYPYGDGSGTYGLVGDHQWYPGDDWRGDVARIVMYVNLRYGHSFTQVGTLELFLKWNREDPVSPFEEQRNNVIEGAQGDRNPFIDNPYLATIIWGGDAAENRWQ